MEGILIGIAIIVSAIIGFKIIASIGKKHQFAYQSNDLRKGMTLEQVVQIMGKPADIATPPMYKWYKNYFGYYGVSKTASITCIFEDNKLIIIEKQID